MFSVRARPWHGLGTVIDTAPTIADAIKLAGLDWRVELEPNYTYLDGAWVETPSQSVIKVERLADGSDFRSVLGSVGPAYTPLQNVDAFKWFQPWLDAGVATLETAGSLDGQRRVWVLARITRDPIVVSGDDEVAAYVLLAHAHDGSLAVRAGLTPIRVVCHNTLSAAIAGGKVESMFRISHTSGMRSRLADAATYGAVEEVAHELVDRYGPFPEPVEALLAVALTAGQDAHNLLVTGGTDNHLVLLDVTSFGLTGRQAESALLDAGVVTNRNAIPADPNGAWYTSGIRLGSPAMTTRGFTEADATTVGNLVADVLDNPHDAATIDRVKAEVKKLADKYPVYAA